MDRNGKPVAQMASSVGRSTRIGAPSRNAPPPSLAEYPRPSMGARITPTTGRPSATSATDTPTTGKPCTKFAVPSRGSTNQPTSAGARRPSPRRRTARIGGRGVVQHRLDRVLASGVGVAHPVTRGLWQAHVVRATEGVEHDSGAGCRGASAAASNRSRSRSAVSGRSPGAGARAAPFVPAATSCRQERGFESSSTRSRPSASTTSAPASSTHQQHAEIVPRGGMLVGVAVEVAVDVSHGDVAQREGSRTQGPELSPPQRHRRPPERATTARSISVV